MKVAITCFSSCFLSFCSVPSYTIVFCDPTNYEMSIASMLSMVKPFTIIYVHVITSFFLLQTNTGFSKRILHTQLLLDKTIRSYSKEISSRAETRYAAENIQLETINWNSPKRVWYIDKKNWANMERNCLIGCISFLRI